MPASAITDRLRDASPRDKARLAGVLYLLAILMGGGAVFVGGKVGSVAYFIAILCNVAVALLFYALLKPAHRSLALLATCLGLATSGIGVLRWHPWGVDVGMIFFGSYCLLIGYLIFKSPFLPRLLGALMLFAGVAWLTFLLPLLASHLAPYNLATGFLGQAALMLWLLVKGVNAQRWREQARAAGARQ